jgi:translation initiation factor eIF-2B subunit gamma
MVLATAPPVQAIILAGAGGSRLFPLNADGLPKVLLPVANRPLLSFPLKMLEEAGIVDVFIVCEGDAAANAVRTWSLAHQQTAPSKSLHLEIVRVPDGLPSVSALRHVLGRIRSETIVIMSGDVVSEVPLRDQLLRHQTNAAAMTALFARRKTAASADTQPGKPPRGVDYVGLLDNDDELAFYLHAPDGVKQLIIPQALTRRYPNLRITTRYVDMQVYCFQSQVLQSVLDSHEEVQKLEEHLLPLMVQRSLSVPRSIAASGAAYRFQQVRMQRATSMHRASSSSVEGLLDGGARAASLADLSLGPTEPSAWRCITYIAPDGGYCQRANTLQGYADINREILMPETASKFLSPSTSLSPAGTPTANAGRGKGGEELIKEFSTAFIGTGVSLGVKVAIGAGSMVGEGCSLGDKSSVKRSVIGRNCILGSNTKVINCVLMDAITVGDNVHLQNCIISSGCTLNTGATLRDCRLGPEITVASGADLKDEVLSNEK